jgi:hypothetical protein
MSDWKNIAGEVGKFAPLLGTLLGGPAGGAIGGMVASALGSNNTPDDVAQALAINPDAAVKLKQIEADHDTRLHELLSQQAQASIAADSARYLADVDNTKDARGMQVGTKAMTPAILAILVTTGFFGVLGTMLFGVWHPSDNNALLILLGSLGTSWGAIVNFYFGSSAGSARKDELLAQSKPS